MSDSANILSLFTNKLESKRECSGCTACCEGWLGGEAHGKKFQSGCPCHFKGESGCSIYDARPQFCKTFNCEWLVNNDLPQWMKPNVSGVIVRKMGWGSSIKMPYYEVLEMGKKIDSNVLNWFFAWHIDTGAHIKIMVDGGWSYYGSNDFKKYFLS